MLKLLRDAKQLLNTWLTYSSAVPTAERSMLPVKVLYLTLNPLTWKIWWAPNNPSRWQMGFNSACKGLRRIWKLRIKLAVWAVFIVWQNLSFCLPLFSLFSFFGFFLSSFFHSFLSISYYLSISNFFAYPSPCMTSCSLLHLSPLPFHPFWSHCFSHVHCFLLYFVFHLCCKWGHLDICWKYYRIGMSNWSQMVICFFSFKEYISFYFHVDLYYMSCL